MTTSQPPRSVSRRHPLGTLALLLAAGTLTACGGGAQSTAKVDGPVRVLSASDFAQSKDATGSSSAPDATSSGGPRGAIPTISASDAREGISDVIVVEGVPESLHAHTPAPAPGPLTAPTSAEGTPQTTTAPTPTARTLGVDRSVGQINGRPIYAAQFLEDMDDRLRRNAEKMKRPEWVKESFNLIGQKLRDEVRDELLLSEFNTNLKPEQKPGIAAFVTKVQEDLRSGNLGSESLANKRLLEEEGKTIQEKARDISDKAFIQDWLRRTVYNRVQVNIREVKRYYENNPADFREPGKAVFRVIQCPKDDAAKIASIEAALAANEDFAAIAERESSWRRDQKEGRFTFEVKIEKDHASADFFGPPALNQAARSLSPGGQTARIDAGSAAWWLKLESSTPPRVIPFFEAQLAIEKKIKNERYREEETRYFNGLMKRSSATNLEEMALKITEFADQRYWGEGRVSTPAATPAPAAGAVSPK
jgi:hypothetical protein